MQEKSVGKNAALNMVMSVIALVFPLITFPHISRILQVENLGKVNFSRSVVNYFVLFATLGLKTYGIREGAALRNDARRFQKFFSQVLSITVVSTVISLTVLYGLVFLSPRMREYSRLIMILSVCVILPTVGCEWVCAVFEDYSYLAICSFIVQGLSMVLIYVIIRKPKDYYLYAGIIAFSSLGTNLFSLLRVRRYVRFSLTGKMDAGRHLKPILVLFASSLATTVFVNSDTTLLGILSGEYHTGLYTAASKLYSVVKSLIYAIVIVSIPRFSYYHGNHQKDAFQALLERISKALCLMVIPAAVGVASLSEEIILLISGESYLPAVPTLRILSVAVVFATASWVQTQCILIPMKKEKWVLYSTIAVALLNVSLNLVLIPRWQHNAAAITTVIAEATAAGIYRLLLRKTIKIPNLHRQVFHGIFGSAVMLVWLLYVKTWSVAVWLRLPAGILGAMGIYAAALLVLRDEVALEYAAMAVKILRRK